ncbi:MULTISPECIES: hypothetical protein [Pseudoalteromonas]|uniref:hypothetical protein n=1 Tax=Pseudoalteromonas TaxID=53246 RepID=UPI000310A9FF|nr:MULTISPECIES: hypothetical protein [Pseudoalteromonas]MCF6142957.1 hypothetical protein [Pseudoalteromonas mariniglutinosa NCIMB 1770]
MDLDEFLKLGLFASLTVAGTIGFARIFFKGYIEQKSKNLATKEDVGEITDIVEKIKHENSRVLEDLKAEHAKGLEEVKKENQLLLSTADKHLDLKINIYTDAMVAFTGIIFSIESFVSLDYSAKEFQLTLEEHSKVISKVQIVGSSEVCEVAIEIITRFNEIVIQLIIEKNGLPELEKKIKELANYYQKLNEENEELGILDKLEGEYKELVTDFTVKYNKFTKLCLYQKIELEELLIKFVTPTRTELGFDVDEDKLLIAQKSSSKRLKAAAKKALDIQEDISRKGLY